MQNDVGKFSERFEIGLAKEFGIRNHSCSAENLIKKNEKKLDCNTHHGQTVALQGYEHVINCLFHVYREIGCLCMFWNDVKFCRSNHSIRLMHANESFVCIYRQPVE